MINNLVTIIMSQINTFTSHDALIEDAEGPELERGAWPVVAWNQRGGSSNHIGARAWHLAAASVSVFGARTGNHPRSAGWRTVRAGDVQNSSRRARATACLFQAQRFAAERDCYRGYREAFDHNRSARKTWLSALQSLLQFVWNLRSIACSPSSYNKCTGCWLRTAFVQ
jgi:hypothetical protein